MLQAIISRFWEKQEQHGSYGELRPPHSLRRRVNAYTIRFDLKPEAIIHDLRVFRKLYILCVVERTLCRAFDACTVFSCFLHPSWGGAYTQEVYHENLRFYRPQAQERGHVCSRDCAGVEREIPTDYAGMCHSL